MSPALPAAGHRIGRPGRAGAAAGAGCSARWRLLLPGRRQRRPVGRGGEASQCPVCVFGCSVVS